ncbi:uncharacterized protein LOC143026089 [Oratosquilla oratoria]|uniref:uncharacterized protein LOC143026089 n=1 Tax=Oratosquilla oratoria TaxID=337810 RepID=UPI003F75A0AD
MELQLLLHDTSPTGVSTHTMQRTLDDSFIFTSPIPMALPRPDTATGTTSRPGSSVSLSSGITPVTSTPAKAKKLIQQKIASYTYVDKMTETQIKEAQLQLARAFYASGCPLCLVGNKLQAKFFKTLKPSFNIPSRDSISNNILERVYQECSVTVKELVASASSFAVMSDSWTIVRNEGIINFIVTVPRPIFWSSIATVFMIFVHLEYAAISDTDEPEEERQEPHDME